MMKKLLFQPSIFLSNFPTNMICMIYRTTNIHTQLSSSLWNICPPNQLSSFLLLLEWRRIQVWMSSRFGLRQQSTCLCLGRFGWNLWSIRSVNVFFFSIFLMILNLFRSISHSRHPSLTYFFPFKSCHFSLSIVHPATFINTNLYLHLIWESNKLQVKPS